MLIFGARVIPAAHLSSAVAVRPFDVEHLLRVVSIHDLVAVDAPELLLIVQVEIARVHAVVYQQHKVEEVSK